MRRVASRVIGGVVLRAPSTPALIAFSSMDARSDDKNEEVEGELRRWVKVMRLYLIKNFVFLPPENASRHQQFHHPHASCRLDGLGI